MTEQSQTPDITLDDDVEGHDRWRADSDDDVEGHGRKRDDSDDSDDDAEGHVRH